MALPLSPQVFTITARLVEDRSGLHYDESDAEGLADKLSERASELGLQSLLDYYYYLRYDPGGEAELRTLVERLVVQETYFFREVGALRVLADDVIPEIVRQRGRARVWSAACATGEEVYTLAMLLDDAGLLERVELVASDISARGLVRAREGAYGGRSLRLLDPSALPRHMAADPRGGARVLDPLPRSIQWKCVNLLDGDAVRALAPFDVVVCRNVLIYFADVTVVRVAEHLREALRPEGWLVVGTSESLLRFGTAFTCEERAGSFFYRRQAE